MREIIRQTENEEVAIPANQLSAAPEATQGPGPAERIEAGPKTTLNDILEDGLSTPPVEKPADKPVKKPVDKVAAMNKARAAKDARAAASKQKSMDDLLEEAAEKNAKKAEEPVDPAQMVKIRQKTVEDLQTAYANGRQKEVFELLSRFGNGAKSFRELPPEAFVPIREAIDNGALT
jgi:hypothetical protein